MTRIAAKLGRSLRNQIARSWELSRVYYRLRGLRLDGHPRDEVWYFAYGANMCDRVFLDRRGMRPLEWRAGRVSGWRLRFNLEGRPRGLAAPANLSLESCAETWGVLYKITRASLVRLDASEGLPGRGYRHAWVIAEDVNGKSLQAVTYVADGLSVDGKPSLRYLTLLREGAGTHGLPEHWLRFLNAIEHARP